MALAVAAAVVLFALGGCGATSGPETAARTAPSPSSSTQEPARSPGTTKTQATTRIAFVNVGQGDAILIKSGRADVLVDGGPEGAARRVAAAMRRAGIRDLDTVVVTHPHADHVGAVDDLTRSHDPERVLVAGRCDPAVRRAARAAGAKLVQTRRGDTYRWGAVKVRVLSPGRLSRDANADGLVLLLEVKGRRILLTGDLTGPNEDRVARLCSQGPALYALKVSHHGSRYATAASFLSATDPRVAVISVGANAYGHPTPQTVRRLHAAGARVYTTRKNGTITLTIGPSGSVKWRFTKSARPVAGSA